MAAVFDFYDFKNGEEGSLQVSMKMAHIIQYSSAYHMPIVCCKSKEVNIIKKLINKLPEGKTAPTPCTVRKMIADGVNWMADDAHILFLFDEKYVSLTSKARRLGDIRVVLSACLPSMFSMDVMVKEYDAIKQENIELINMVGKLMGLDTAGVAALMTGYEKENINSKEKGKQ